MSEIPTYPDEGEEPYCDVCGRSGSDLCSAVEVCRDCLAGAELALEWVKRDLDKAQAECAALRAEVAAAARVLSRTILQQNAHKSEVWADASSKALIEYEVRAAPLYPDACGSCGGRGCTDCC